MWSTHSAVYVYDAYNVHKYEHVMFNVYEHKLNGLDMGHQLCKVTSTSINCLFGIKYNETSSTSYGRSDDLGDTSSTGTP